VVNLTSEKIYDEQTFLPQRNAINDPRMGVTNKDLLCHTCNGDVIDCPGHFGHIDLAKPVFHPGLIDMVRKILKCVCFNCSKLLITDMMMVERIRKIPYPK
jgi:DNA-directed RNA polymerase II subunit RPB1